MLTDKQIAALPEGWREYARAANNAMRRAEGDLSPEALRVFVKMRDEDWRRTGTAHVFADILAALAEAREAVGVLARRCAIDVLRDSMRTDPAGWDGPTKQTGQFADEAYAEARKRLGTEPAPAAETGAAEGGAE